MNFQQHFYGYHCLDAFVALMIHLNQDATDSVFSSTDRGV